MVDEIDKLPDWAYTESELDQMAEDILENINLQLSGHLVMYKMYKDGVGTGVVMLLAVESISDGLHAINRLWGQYGMHAEIGEFTEDEDNAMMYRLNALEIVLDKYRYVGKIKCAGSNKLYRYNRWMNNLL